MKRSMNLLVCDTISKHERTSQVDNAGEPGTQKKLDVPHADGEAASYPSRKIVCHGTCDSDLSLIVGIVTID